MRKRWTTVGMAILWFLEGVAVGFGGILPGVSGGTLCAAFGMYRPLVDCFSHPLKGLKAHGVMLACFLAGGLTGFVGLAGIGAGLLEAHPLEVTWCFLGMLIGTFPSLWQDAGKEGRCKKGYFSLAAGFLTMTGILLTFKSPTCATLSPDGYGFAFCGVFWGLSLLVPGLSASSLLMFLGLYEPMLFGIGSLDVRVIIPLGAGMACTLLFLGKIVELGFRRYHEILSHGVLGCVAATAVMLFPGVSLHAPLWFLLGGALSYTMTVWGEKAEKLPQRSSSQKNAY